MALCRLHLRKRRRSLARGRQGNAVGAARLWALRVSDALRIPRRLSFPHLTH